jgi:hypothetical protein
VANGVSAAAARREQFDILVEFSAIDLVLDAVVRTMNLVIEVLATNPLLEGRTFRPTMERCSTRPDGVT